jgi:sulfatase modifying factor 1
MKSWRSVVSALVLFSASWAQAQPSPLPATRIAELVRQLGGESFALRETAAKGLVALGESALPALRGAADGDDLELRRRAKQIERAILLTLRTSKSTAMTFAVVEAGAFEMGSSNTEPGRRPDETAHRVQITRSFLLGAYEVTQDEYQQVMKANPSGFAETGAGKDRVAGQKTGRFPVEQVTWFDAVEFCNRLSQLDGYPPYYQIDDAKREGANLKSAAVTIRGGNGYRLPTEADWEYASRAGSTKPFHFGTNNTGREANVKPGTTTISYTTAPQWQAPNRTVKVGSFSPNFWGLHDMHGNTAEWCGDWYDKDYYPSSPPQDPPGPASGVHRVLRGGSWMVNQAACRSASRFWLPPGEAANHVGFRVARTP